MDELYSGCPCAERTLNENNDGTSIWKVVYTCIVLALMFGFLVTDRLGADSIMLTALTALIAGRIISVQEGIAGFANSGLLTVLVLFVVAEGISKTGALDWYMQKLLGRPKSVGSAQLRLMVPIAIVSAFLNNTPVVAVLIPIVLRWAKNIRLPAQQLLIPLSFASILGGTCTLIGTSTNFVVVGLLEARYGDELKIGLFDLGKFGVPVALAGMAYILLLSPYLLPSREADIENDTSELLLGARLTPWSPAAGRTVRRSGLRDTGGIFLVSVHRAATGNVHRAVSADFVLQPGDILYFTGLVESFGEFCLEHGLQVITSEAPEQEKGLESPAPETDHQTGDVPKLLDSRTDPLATVEEDDNLFLEGGVPVEVGVTKESLLQADEGERLRNIIRMTDLIRGNSPQPPSTDNAPKVVVTVEKELVVVGINARDRTGLLLDVSKSLLRFHVQLRHTEAAVVGDRSISIWRCEVRGTGIPDIEEIWSVLNDLLSDERGPQKERGLRVIRARIAKRSRLIGRMASEINFRQDYGVALIAPSVHDKRQFKAGDQLVLQAADHSPLLERPPDDFVQQQDGNVSRSSSVGSFVKKLGFRKSSADLSQASTDEVKPSTSLDRQQGTDEEDFGFFVPSDDEDDPEEEGKPPIEINNISNVSVVDEEERKRAAWSDLRVVFRSKNDEEVATREFLTAMAVSQHSQLSGKSAKQVGLDKLPDLYLVTIDRPAAQNRTSSPRHRVNVLTTLNDQSSVDESSVLESVQTEKKLFDAIDQDELLEEGDILWFSGPAQAVGDLRKIPGLESYENEEVEKIHGKVLDRRLVQAVVARKGPLVGKTIKSVRFRTQFGAAVIAVHRGGTRVHEHPGNVKLQAGDVLLLEAGPSFVAKNAENDRSFALLAEVADSAPPRLRLLIPSLIIAALMLAVFMANLSSLLVSGLVAAVLMVSIGILSEQEARDAVNWEVYLTIAAAFGIGTALVNSGIAEAMAKFLVWVGTSLPLGEAGLLGAVYFATFLVSNIVTNNAAAALLFPIALEAAEQTGTDRLLMSYSLMLGASASFMTPFGYTTNLLIYGPGRYKYNDFLKFGTPMQLVLLLLSAVFLVFADYWWVSWLASFFGLVLIASWRLGPSLKGLWGSRGETADAPVEPTVTARLR